TGEAEGLGVVEIAAAREVGDRGVCPRDPVAVLKMALERLEGVAEPGLQEGDDLLRALVLGQEVHQEPHGAGLRGHLVIVPEHPAQYLVAGARCAAEPARPFHDVVHDRAGLGEDLALVLEYRHLAHDVEPAQLRRAGGAVEEVDEDRLPVVAGQGQRQRRLVGIAALAEAVKAGGHVALPWLAAGAGASRPAVIGTPADGGPMATPAEWSGEEEQ